LILSLLFVVGLVVFTPTVIYRKNGHGHFGAKWYASHCRNYVHAQFGGAQMCMPLGWGTRLCQVAVNPIRRHTAPNTQRGFGCNLVLAAYAQCGNSVSVLILIFNLPARIRNYVVGNFIGHSLYYCCCIVMIITVINFITTIGIITIIVAILITTTITITTIVPRRA